MVLVVSEVYKINFTKKYIKESSRTFGTFTSANIQADTSACKRAIFCQYSKDNIEG